MRGAALEHLRPGPVARARKSPYLRESMGESTGPSRRVAVDAIILAFKHSKLAGITDSLRKMVDASFGDMVTDGTLDLDILWELLEEQDAFDADAAKGPLCAIKSWEERLGAPVSLPQALSNLSDTEVALIATKMRISDSDVRRVFESDEERAERMSNMLAAQEEAAERTSGGKHLELAWYERKEAAMGAGAVLLVSLAVVGITLFGGRAGNWEDLDPNEFAEDIPVESAQQLGKQVGAELVDASWLDGPDDARRAAMKTALVNLQSRNVEVFYIRDSSGAIRATAQWYGNPPDVKIVFR